MSASVLFCWNGPDKEYFQGQGVTRDMSVAGVFVLTATCPPVHSVVHAEVLLPPSDGGSKTTMKADMKVLRVEHDIGGDNRSGFSAVGNGFALRAISKQLSHSTTDPAKGSEG
jgi:hypothetical protein